MGRFKINATDHIETSVELYPTSDIAAFGALAAYAQAIAEDDNSREEWKALVKLLAPIAKKTKDSYAMKRQQMTNALHLRCTYILSASENLQ